MDQSQINGPNGFHYDSSAWAQSIGVDQVDPAFFFGDDDSAAAGQQGYGLHTQAPVPYSQNQSDFGTYNSGYPSQGFNQYQQFPSTTSIEHNAPPPTSHHLAQGADLLNGYAQPYNVRQSISPAGQQLAYPAPNAAAPYQPQAAPSQGMDGYNSPRPTNNGYVQNSVPQQVITGFPQNQQTQFFNQAHTQQQAALPVQQQRVSTPQQQHQVPNQLLYAQAQKQQAIQHQKHLQARHQHVQIQQQQQRVPTQQQHVSAPVYQPQPGAQQRAPAQQQQPSQPMSQYSAPRPIPASIPAAAVHFATFSPQQQHLGLAVPDRLLKSTTTAVLPTSAGRWTGMHHAFISEIPEDASAKFSNETLMPVFARTERRRLFKERSLLIPAEGMGRYMDSLKSIASDDPQAGVKHRTRRLVLEYDLQRVGALDRDALDTYDKIPKSGPSKFQAEARKRGFEYPPLAPQSSISDLDLLEMRTAAMLDLPTTWTPDSGLLQQVAADFAEFLFQVVKELRQLPEYKELLNTIKASKGKSAVSTQDTTQGDKLRAANEKGRERVQRVVATALRSADDRVLAVLSPNRIAIPFQTVINLFNTGDINAPLTKALLNFAGRLPFLDDSMIEGFKWDKLLTRLEDGGDDDVKAAVRKIKDIVKSNEGKPPMLPKQASTPTANAEAPSRKTAAKVNAATSGNGASKVSTSTVTSKRSRKDDDDGEGRVTKKPATGASALQASASQTNSQSSQNSSKPTTTVPAQSKSASTTILNALKARASSGALPGKSRATTKVPSKPEAMKHERTESENKPSSDAQSQPSSTSNLDVPKSATNSATTSGGPRKMNSNEKKEDIKPEPSRSGSSFAALMSEIEKPKPVKRPAPSPEKTEVPIDETDDERGRRLRKEKRRRLGLRVSFKSEPELTAVRIFHKEEAEDEERDNHMIRDANDDKAEGRLLKASRSSQIDINREWEEPVLIDFGTLPEEQREKTYTTRGGKLRVESEQQRVMAEREMTEVMVVYTDSADIPASASSPRAETEMDFEPSGVVVHADSNLAARVALYMACGSRGGLDLLLKRRTAATTSTAAMLVNRVQAVAPYQNFDDLAVRQAKDEQVLKALNSAAARSYVDPDPAHPQLSKIRRDYTDPNIQAASKFLEAIVSQLAGLPAPAQEPPMWQQDPARREEWIKGFNNDKRAEEATRQAAQQSAVLNHNPTAQQAAQDPYAQYYAQLQAAAQSGNQQQHQQQPQQQPVPDPLAATFAALQSAGQTATQPAQTNPLQALMAAFGNQQQQQQTPAVDPNQALQLAMWAAASGGVQQQQPQQPPSAQQFLNPTQPGFGTGYGQDNSNSNGQRDDGGDHRNRERGRRGGKDGGGRGGDEDHLRGINRSLIGTKPCTFWARGNCNRGDKCTFRHD